MRNKICLVAFSCGETARATLAMELLGIKLVGFNLENAQKLALTMAFILVGMGCRSLAIAAVRGLLRPRHERAAFWTQQAISLSVAAALTISILSIWFDDPVRLTTAMGLVTAGLAFALQKVITAVAGYFVILRGNTFSVGDRITMGGVRGDVIGLGFVQTTIMEMGQPPAVQSAEPAIWVRSRQFTGRIVTVTNDKIFDEPIYNYTRDFPFIWEEISIPISYIGDRRRAEEILLATAGRHALSVAKMGASALDDLRQRYFVQSADVEPRVFYRMTADWLELTVRFLVDAYGVREIKDGMARDILQAFEEAGLEVASATFEITHLPPLQVRGLAGPESGSKSGPIVPR